MKTKTLVVILIICLGSFLLAQQGKYKRKSITSLGLYQVTGETLSPSTKSISLENQISNPRFDYNQLSDSELKVFRSELRKSNPVIVRKFTTFELLTQLNPLKSGWMEAEDPPVKIDSEIITEILNGTVSEKIFDVLNDPELIKIRSADFFDESVFQSFAMTKAKSLGITVDEISQIMNSSYVYLPFIEKSWTPETDAFTVRGGILCWHLEIDDNGKVKYVNVLNKTGVTGIGSGEVWVTNEKESAYIHFSENIAIELKVIDDFKLTSQIIEEDGNKYSFTTGKVSGSYLNKSFFLAEVIADKYGRENIKRNGYALITEEGGGENYTVAKRIFGRGVSVGDIVIENPRDGYETQTSFSVTDGESRDIEEPMIEEPMNYLNSQLNGLSFILSSDISHVTGIRDLWLQVGLRLQSVPELNNNAFETFGYGITYQYTLSKRFRLNRFYLGLGSGYGINFAVSRFKITGPTQISFNNTIDTTITADLFTFGFFFSPVIELGLTLPAGARIFVKAGILPSIAVHGLGAKDSSAFVNYGDDVFNSAKENTFWSEVSPYGKFGTHVISPIFINVGISRAISVVPRSWGFMNQGFRNKKKKMSIKLIDWLFPGYSQRWLNQKEAGLR